MIKMKLNDSRNSYGRQPDGRGNMVYNIDRMINTPDNKQVEIENMNLVHPPYNFRNLNNDYSDEMQQR